MLYLLCRVDRISTVYYSIHYYIYIYVRAYSGLKTGVCALFILYHMLRAVSAFYHSQLLADLEPRPGPDDRLECPDEIPSFKKVPRVADVGLYVYQKSLVASASREPLIGPREPLLGLASEFRSKISGQDLNETSSTLNTRLSSTSTLTMVLSG